MSDMTFGMTALVAGNAVVAAASVAFAVVAAVRPQAVSHTAGAPSGGERFYAWMYVARALPLGLLAGIVPLASTGTVSMFCLVVAAVVQAADAGIGLSRRRWTMVGGAALAVAVHTVTALAIA